MVPLWMVGAVGACLAAVLAWWTWHSSRDTLADGRQPIVFWGSTAFGEDIYTVINRFEQANPQYRVIMGTAVARNLTGDAQRLLCAVAGGVPPDVVFFDRFAIGEWAGRGALTDLTPYIESQKPDDPCRLDLGEYYAWSIEEASYRPPGSNQKPGIFGIPVGVDVRVLYSNADLLRQEGLVDEKGEPRPPRTWDELRRYAAALTQYNDPNDKSKGLKRLGFGPNYGNSWLYMYAWQAGGEFMNTDRTRVTLDAPEVVRALRFMADIYDDAGGFKQAEAFRQSFQGGEMDPFLRGQVAMKIDGDWSLAGIADWKRDMDFIISPAPMPEDQLRAETALTTVAKVDFAISRVRRAARPGDTDHPECVKLLEKLRAHLESGRDAASFGFTDGQRALLKRCGITMPITWAGGWSLVIPATARNKDGAWKLIQYLRSWPVMELLEQGKREQKESEGRLYLPSASANRRFYEKLIEQYVDGNPHMPPRFKQAYAVLKEMMPNTLFRPVTPVGQLLWEQHRMAYEAGVGHVYRHLTGDPDEEMRIALSRAQEPVQKMLDELLRPLPPETRVDWRPYFAGYGALVAMPFVLMWLVFLRRRREYSYKAREVGAALLFAAPWIMGFIVFVGGPILFSIVFSFTRYNVLSPAHYVGLDNYRQVFADELFYKSLGNTLFMVLRIPLVMAVGLAIAMLLDRAIRGIGIYRTALYMPAIVPLVASSLLWIWIFNPSQGALNQFLNWLFDTAPFELLEKLIAAISGRPFAFVAPLWLQDENWSKPGLILMNLWGAGGGMIIWLAGLQAIPQQLYEAASIDGAGPWKRFIHITIPMLSPYILFNLVIGLIGTMQIFGEAFIMTEGGPNNSTLFYAYHLFREGFQFFRMGKASALAWILFVIVLVLTMVQMWLSRKWVHYERA